MVDVFGQLKARAAVFPETSASVFGRGEKSSDGYCHHIQAPLLIPSNLLDYLAAFLLRGSRCCNRGGNHPHPVRGDPGELRAKTATPWGSTAHN